MYMTPEFWTRIVILIDSSSFSLSAITSQLAWSRDLILELAVTSRAGTLATANGEHERARVMSVMRVIGPHIRRCRAIAFNVRFSSSLPSFPNGFNGAAKYLRSLKLECAEDDGGADDGTMVPAAVHDKFPCPNISRLIIDGRNYYNACQRNIHWTEMLPYVRDLSISHFTPVTTRSESFTTSNFLRSLDPLLCLNSLHINNVQFHQSSHYEYLEVPDDLPLKTIVLENLQNANSVDQLIGVLGQSSDDIQIIRCRRGYQSAYEGNLSLKDIDSSEILIAHLRVFWGPTLVIDDCPGLNDDVLKAMATPDFHNTSFHCARDVRHFSILNCPNISVPALKQLVETRLHIALAGLPVGAALPITMLRLSGCDLDISTDDRNWFSDRLSQFSYD